jgi:hypothetical protein
MSNWMKSKFHQEDNPMNTTHAKEKADVYDPEEHTTPHKTTGIKDYDSLKASVVTIAGANSDGKNLFIDVEVFDGEHTNRFETIWPADTNAKAITDYAKSIIEKNPKLSNEIVGLMNKKVFWNTEEKGWYMQEGNTKALRMDKDDKSGKSS